MPVVVDIASGAWGEVCCDVEQLMTLLCIVAE